MKEAFDREIKGFFEYYSEDPDSLTHAQVKLMHLIYTYIMRDDNEQQEAKT